MEARKRKQISGKNSSKGVRRNVNAACKDDFQPSTINYEKSSIYNTCPHCAGNSFEDLRGVCETGLCVECEHKKIDWLIAKRQAQIKALKKKRPAATKRRRRGKQQIL